MREELKLLENACRQAAAWREDTRWLGIGLMLEQAHQRSLHWLRYKFPRPLFTKLAENLRACQTASEKLRDAATGKIGAILPEPLPDRGPQRDTTPVQVKIPMKPELENKPAFILPGHVAYVKPSEDKGLWPVFPDKNE